MKKWKKVIAVAAIIAGLGLVAAACKDNPKNNGEAAHTKAVEDTTDSIVNATAFSRDGKKLEMSFNNNAGTAVLKFEGQTIELTEQRAGSGIWYKSEVYELRGKGNDVELAKNGTVIFTTFPEGKGPLSPPR